MATYLVMVLSGNKEWNEFGRNRLYNYQDDNGKYIHRYPNKELARADARKFNQLIPGYKYEVVKIK